MPRNGSGTYSRSDGVRTGATTFQQQKAAAIKITASLLDTEAQDMADALTASIAKDGQTTPTANLPMGGFKHTNVANGTAASDYAALGQVQTGAPIWGGTSGGSGNAQTITLTPAPAALTTGLFVRFIAGFSNTGAVTLNTNALGAIAIRSGRDAAVALSANCILAGALISLVYDGTVWRLLAGPDQNRLQPTGADLTLGPSDTNNVQFQANGSPTFLWATLVASLRLNTTDSGDIGTSSVFWANSYVTDRIYRTEDNISAAGSTISDATQLSKTTSYVSTVTAGQGVKLLDGNIGCERVVTHVGASNLKVYPPNNSQNFATLGGGAAITLVNPGAYASLAFRKISATKWAPFGAASA